MIALALSALAHAAPCADLVTVEAWRDDLLASERALGGTDVRAGQERARMAAQTALCLDAVPSPEDVTRLGRVMAVAAFYDQDTDQMAQWAVLAMSTAPGTEWPTWLHGDHPARVMIDEVVPTGWSGWRDLGVAAPRKGGAFLNGRWLDVPIFPVAAPNLVQVFDAKGERVDAWWQHGAAAPPELLVGDPGPARAPRWFQTGPAITDLAG